MSPRFCLVGSDLERSFVNALGLLLSKANSLWLQIQAMRICEAGVVGFPAIVPPFSLVPPSSTSLVDRAADQRMKY